MITTKELGERVQEVSGARTTVLLQHWITKLLDAVATQAAAAGEPPLASLVVRPDGGAGAAYGRSARTAGDEAVADLDALAAQHRLLCYQAFAEDLPDGGGRVTLTPRWRPARSAPGRRSSVRSTSARCTTSRCRSAGTARLCD
ncbi:hypothetical protein GCM10025868_33970 [Angustibacter aerolatus]|uniref:Uncharacterized protein n=1 Tax=Angustibacter aerolatus TaxID=1162965 RepID=A0ABQ6JK55_9ACTN|nr:hypothetical protein [Angustibacter aerolatus]GMA88147.1 hypothetical protein GCM10025868_33970 [Angustibacter aerolatus]